MSHYNQSTLPHYNQSTLPQCPTITSPPCLSLPLQQMVQDYCQNQQKSLKDLTESKSSKFSASTLEEFTMSISAFRPVSYVLFNNAYTWWLPCIACVHMERQKWTPSEISATCLQDRTCTWMVVSVQGLCQDCGVGAHVSRPHSHGGHFPRTSHSGWEEMNEAWWTWQMIIFLPDWQRIG